MSESHALPSGSVPAGAFPPGAEALLRHEAFVRSLARRLVGDAASADDLAQDTWLAALTHAPGHGSLKAWLGRIVRNRASNARRDSARRDARERTVARKELDDSPAKAREALELQHLVVGAVLSLPEPYRDLVIAVHFENRKPADLARERGVPPGTIRSQLSRALDLLREKLDRERGSREAWSGALLAFSLREGSVSGAAVTASSTSPLAVALAATVAVSVGAWALFELSARPSGRTAELERLDEPSTAPEVEALASAAGVRTPIEAASDPLTVPEEPQVTRVAPEASGSLAELRSMLARMRQIKRELIERATTPEPEVLEEYAWLLAQPDAGVTRLAAREKYGFDLDLPWLDGGGAYWSFTERTHDYQTDPQIELQGRRIGTGFYGGATGVVYEVDEDIDLETLIQRGSETGDYIGTKLSVWSNLWNDPWPEWNRGEHHEAREWRVSRGFDAWTTARQGRRYFVRAWSPDEFDVAVVLEIARLSPEGATIAWKIVREWPIADPNEPYVWRERPESLPPAPELEQLDDAKLCLELEVLRVRGTLILFDMFPPSLQDRAAALAGRRDAGLVRIVDRSTSWTEFKKVREGGAYWSFATWSHDPEQEPNVSLESGYFNALGAGDMASWMIDVGEVDLADVERCELPTGARELLWDRGLDLHGPVPRGEGPSAGLVRFIPAVAGHTYLLRSSYVDGHDLLVALRCAVLDEYGAFLEWRVLFEQER